MVFFDTLCKVNAWIYRSRLKGWPLVFHTNKFGPLVKLCNVKSTETEKPKSKIEHLVLLKLKLKHWIPGEEVSSSNDGGGGGGGWLRFFFPHGKNTLFIRFQLPLLDIIDDKRIQGNNLPEKPPRFKLIADFPFLDQKLRWTEPRRMANSKCWLLFTSSSR